MRAAVLRSAPGDLTVEEIETDTPRPREVLVRTVAAGLCHSDLHFMDALYPYDLPAVLGHEAAGIVEAVGSEVTHVRPGDHVIGCLSTFCGECSFCLSGRPQLCRNHTVWDRASNEPSRLSSQGEPIRQFLRLSAFAEQMLVHENAVVRIDSDIPLDRAALVGCGVTTGLGAVFRTAAVRPGQSVAVIGLGGVGLSAIQGARIAGASQIIAVDRVAAKLDTALEMGATHTVEAGAGDTVKEVKRISNGGVEHAFEAVGLASTAEQAFRMLIRGGTATVIGMIPVGERVSLPGNYFMDERRIQGCDMGSNRFRVDMPRYLELYRQGRLKLDELISQRIGLDEINSGFEQMRSGEVLRTVVTFD